MSSGASKNSIGINKFVSGESQNPSLVHSSPATTLSDDVDNSGPGGPEFISTRVIDRDASAPRPKAEDTLGGTNSADVHGGIGKPIQGQSSVEMRHDGSHGRSRQRNNVQTVERLPAEPVED